MSIDAKIREHPAMRTHALPAAVHDDVVKLQRAVAAVLDLHKPFRLDENDDDPWCDAEIGYAWPCHTVQALAAALGVKS